LGRTVACITLNDMDVKFEYHGYACHVDKNPFKSGHISFGKHILDMEGYQFELTVYTMDPIMNYCLHGGYLVNACGTVPTDPNEYYAEGLPKIGCNRLRCGRCQAAVRQVAKRTFCNEHADVDLNALYEAADLSTSPVLKQDEGTRLYLCRCK